MMQRIIVTGASGNIGKHVLDCLAEQNVKPIAWSRKPPTGWNGEFQHYDLMQELPPIEFPSIVLHLAADIQEKIDLKDEVHALENLFNHPKIVKVFFVSSKSALLPTSEYGKRKSFLETICLKRQGVVIRPGLVTSFPATGAFKTLMLVARFSLFAPNIEGIFIQPVSLNFVAQSLSKICTQPSSMCSEEINICSESGASSAELLAQIRHVYLAANTFGRIIIPRWLILTIASLLPYQTRNRLRSVLTSPKMEPTPGFEAINADEKFGIS